MPVKIGHQYLRGVVGVKGFLYMFGTADGPNLNDFEATNCSNMTKKRIEPGVKLAKFP